MWILLGVFFITLRRAALLPLSLLKRCLPFSNTSQWPSGDLLVTLQPSVKPEGSTMMKHLQRDRPNEQHTSYTLQIDFYWRVLFRMYFDFSPKVPSHHFNENCELLFYFLCVDKNMARSLMNKDWTGNKPRRPDASRCCEWNWQACLLIKVTVTRAACPVNLRRISSPD